MISHFIYLQWKQFFRSSYWKKSIAIKILMAFFGLYFTLIFLGMGITLYLILKKTYPDIDPLTKVNQFLFYWFLADLLFRFFLQKLPVMNVKPLLILPIKKSKIINYILGKSILSYFNFLPLFAVIPFGATLLYNGYATSEVFSWLGLMIIATLIINFLNFLIESKSSETELSFLPIIAVSALLFGLNYFGILSLSEWVAMGVDAIMQKPYLLLIPSLILAVVYFFNYKTLLKKISLDDSLKTKETVVNASNLEWTQRFGNIAPFLQLDLRLIWRNKRTRSTIYLMAIGLLYGLFFYPNPSYADKEWVHIFVGIFVTGIFLINFGQFIPAWDSEYYKLLMSQNIRYKDYLKSKYFLMTASAVILFILSIPYVYFGWKILLVHFVAMLYNIGINTYVLLYAGAYNRKRIDLTQKSAFNFQGTGAVQWIVGIPLLIVPMVIFLLISYLVNFEAACAVLSLMSLIGIVLHQKTIKLITKKYLKVKHQMITAFEQKN